MDKKDFERIQTKNMIENLIFDGYAAKEFEHNDLKWKLRTLTYAEQMEAFAMLNGSEDDLTKSMLLKMSMLKISFIALNGISLSKEKAEESIDKLPPILIDALYNDYMELERSQREAINKEDILREIVKENFNRIRFKVMRAAGALPTEQRVKDMTDAQYLWYYLNLVEDRQEEMDIRRSELDYLSYFINPDMAKVVQESRNNENKGTSVRTVTNGNVTTTYKDNIVNADFEKELEEALNGEPLTELGSSTEKGNKYESKDNFLQRVQSFGKVVKQQQEEQEAKIAEEKRKQIEQIEQEAKNAGIDPSDVDFFDIDD